MARRSLCSLLLVLSLLASLRGGAEDPKRVDRFGDPLPEQALARLGTVRFVHGSRVNCLAYSPDGKYLASGSENDTIVLWDAQSGRKIHLLKHFAYRAGLAFSADSTHLVTASHCGGSLVLQLDCDLRVWNVATGKLVSHLPKIGDSIMAIALSPDGKTIASGHHGGVRLWDAQTGKMKRHLWADDTGLHNVTAVAFTPDGKRMAAGGHGGNLKLMDFETGKELQREGKEQDVIHGLAFSPDGRVLASAYDVSGIRLDLVSTLEKIHQLNGHHGEVRSIAFSRDGKTLVSGGADGTIRIWDPASGKEIRQLLPKIGRVDAFAVSPDSKIVASAGDYLTAGTIQLWDLQTGVGRHPCGSPLRTVHEAAFLPDGHTVVLRLGGFSRISDWTEATSHAVVWPNGTGKQSYSVELPKGSEVCWLCADGNTLAVTTKAGVLLLLDRQSGREMGCCPIGEGSRVLDISPDTKRAAVQDTQERTQIWDLTTKKVLQRLEPPETCFGFSPDSRRIAVGIGDRARILNLDTKQELVCCESPGDIPFMVWSCAFSPDGRMLAMQSQSNIRLWETSTGKLRLKLGRESETNHSMVFSPDGKTLATGGAGNPMVRLYDVRDGKELHVFPGHLGDVKAVAFSPDGHRLVSGSEDSTALIWEIPASCVNRKLMLVPMDQGEQKRLWEKLLGDDAASAYAALHRFAASPAEAVSLSRKLLFAGARASPQQIQRWIAQLDDDEYTTREQASGNLERVEGEAEKALENALRGKCSPEVRRRIEVLLETLKGKQLLIRVLRVVELLEQIGTPEALELLQQLEKKTGDTAIRDDVRRSLGRLAARQKSP